jgi:hypothetical protein
MHIIQKQKDKRLHNVKLTRCEPKEERETAVAVGVITKTKYVGFPDRNIGYPVFNLSPLPKS